MGLHFILLLGPAWTVDWALRLGTCKKRNRTLFWSIWINLFERVPPRHPHKADIVSRTVCCDYFLRPIRKLKVNVWTVNTWIIPARSGLGHLKWWDQVENSNYGLLFHSYIPDWRNHFSGIRLPGKIEHSRPPPHLLSSFIPDVNYEASICLRLFYPTQGLCCSAHAPFCEGPGFRISPGIEHWSRSLTTSFEVVLKPFWHHDTQCSTLIHWLVPAFFTLWTKWVVHRDVWISWEALLEEQFAYHLHLSVAGRKGILFLRIRHPHCGGTILDGPMQTESDRSEAEKQAVEMFEHQETI